MIPFTHPAPKIDQEDSENKDMGWSYMFQEKVIKNILLLAVGVAKKFPKSNVLTGADTINNHMGQHPPTSEPTFRLQV